MFELMNCGHKAGSPVVLHNGYTACNRCARADAEAAITHRLPRAVVWLDGSRVCAGKRDAFRLGTVVSRTVNSGAQTPTGGRFTSDRMTIVDRNGGKWFANGKSGAPCGFVTLRRA
jgi:hypothetical protein